VQGFGFEDAPTALEARVLDELRHGPHLEGEIEQHLKLEPNTILPTLKKLIAEKKIEAVAHYKDKYGQRSYINITTAGMLPRYHCILAQIGRSGKIDSYEASQRFGAGNLSLMMQEKMIELERNPQSKELDYRWTDAQGYVDPMWYWHSRAVSDATRSYRTVSDILKRVSFNSIRLDQVMRRMFADGDIMRRYRDDGVEEWKRTTARQKAANKAKMRKQLELLARKGAR